MRLQTSTDAPRGIARLSNAPEFEPETVLAVPNQVLSGLSLLLIRWIMNRSYTDTYTPARAKAASAGDCVISRLPNGLWVVYPGAQVISCHAQKPDVELVRRVLRAITVWSGVCSLGF